MKKRGRLIVGRIVMMRRLRGGWGGKEEGRDRKGKKGRVKRGIERVV